ncbi:GNAT family acetyltransferase NAT4 [Colletotrichum plurivorum]|uniref:N-alpha-acetyltransferase 40 n=1 Tax=Colletotrichum plurivorum TaxID=2175906 RepID=A0A8H6K0K9_9PEZI|nr:GNAT family acetyltransferase NAT4 [Colletotrichum plurivorum]
MPPGKRRRAPTNPIEAANRKTDEDFIRDHLPPRSATPTYKKEAKIPRSSAEWTSWTHPTTDKPYTLELRSAGRLSDDELRACYDLVEHTSGADYRASAGGWKPAQKMREMRSPELRYVLVTGAASEGEGDGGTAAAGKIRGFTSLMPTFEEGEPVVYCYEIHLMEELRGTGMGRKLMDIQIAVARSIPIVEKVMLTCFVANASARAFYDKLGFERDAISPPERKLRFGKVFVPDYVIMSRRVRGGEEEQKRKKSKS